MVLSLVTKRDLLPKVSVTTRAFAVKQAFTGVLWKGSPDTSLEAFLDADWAGDSDDRRSTKFNTKLLLTLLLSLPGFKLFFMSLVSVHLQLLTMV
ncbi:hypothetical protein Tco_1113762 [Tanacetum coccineum]|uniref:Uncharacterized protein n=1 Tax=Tanacetum coccineum TaxID=301880 RepID=A0ABQ5ITD7_9ASTR